MSTSCMTLFAQGYNHILRFVPVNHKLLRMQTFCRQLKGSHDTDGKQSWYWRKCQRQESLFKCLPEKGVVAERYWGKRKPPAC